jgi:hypothetical protein
MMWAGGEGVEAKLQSGTVKLNKEGAAWGAGDGAGGFCEVAAGGERMVF